jgi:hypothetical protein
MRPNAYTEQDDRVLREMWERGASHSSIAERLNRSKFSVGEHCRRVGLLRDKTSPWTPENDALLRDRRAKGHTFAQIASELGIGRNACIGRALREGIISPEKIRTKKVRAPRPRKVKTARIVALRKSKAAPLPLADYFGGVTLLDLEPGQCRYPQGDLPTILFCGQPVVGETSWCEHCSRIVYSGKKPQALSLAERYRRLRQGKRNYKQQQARAA